MAYDSASETAKAGQAWAAAKLRASQKRTALNTGYGLNSDGSMDNSDLGHLGSLYQGNLGSVMDMQAAETSDRRRGFGGSGLGSKGGSAARETGLQRQAINMRDATTQLGYNTQEADAADQQYENDKTNIHNASVWDAAQNIIDNPIEHDQGGLTQTQFAPVTNSIVDTARRITGTKSAPAAIKKNQKIIQNVRNRNPGR